MTHESNPNRAPAAPDHDNETGRRVYDDPHGRVAARYPVAPVPASTGSEPMTERERFFYNMGRASNAAPVAARELDADAERRAVDVMTDRRAFAEWFNGTMYRPDAEEAMLMGWQASTAHYAARATAESAPASAAPREAEKVLVLRSTLELIDAAMNYMGDQLNGMDAVEEEDEDKCTPAFEAIRALLGGPK